MVAAGLIDFGPFGLARTPRLSWPWNFVAKAAFCAAETRGPKSLRLRIVESGGPIRKPAQPLRSVSKRLLDVSGALVLIVWYLPIMIVAVILLRVSRAGRVFTTESIAGVGGRPFKKFGFAALDGNRRIDRFVAASGLHCVPSAVNVLVGHMSLVGPVARKARQAGHGSHRARGVFAGPAIRPGLFGFGSALNDYQAWREASYIANWSLARDIAILARLLASSLLESPDARCR